MAVNTELSPSGDPWQPHPEDLEVWMKRANPQFTEDGRTLCAVFRGLTVYRADVEDAYRFADDPHDPISVAQMVVNLVSLRYRLPQSPFDEIAIEHEP